MTADAQWKVLLIDDEADIREVMSLALEDAGYQVATAADGEAGLQLCETFAPQIVLTDVRMPRMDGIQVLEAIKKRFADTEVIVVTAFGEMDLAVRALQLDASDFITKPVNDQALFLALNRARQRVETRSQLRDYTRFLEREHAATAEELTRNVAFQRNLIESSMDGILGCDRRLRVVLFNRSLERMLGYLRADVVQRRTLENFLSPAESVRMEKDLDDERFGGRGRLFLWETALLDREGRPVPVQLSAVRMEEDRSPEGLVLFIRDLRTLRRLEREMADQARVLHQDKMMSLGRLSASVVHEINNPLSGILNYCRLMRRLLGDGPPSRPRLDKFGRYLELMENETARCSQIVSSLLTFSRRSTPSFGPVNVTDMLERCVVLSRHKMELQNIRLETRIAGALPAVHGDFNQLQQCVINLLFNAIDALPEGGIIRLEAGIGQDPGLLDISIHDTGPGISAEDRSRIFEPFFTTKQEGFGVGLGLSTVFGIMEQHGGSLAMDSGPERGTRFSLLLPIQ